MSFHNTALNTNDCEDYIPDGTMAQERQMNTCLNLIQGKSFLNGTNDSNTAVFHIMSGCNQSNSMIKTAQQGSMISHCRHRGKIKPN